MIYLLEISNNSGKDVIVRINGSQNPPPYPCGLRSHETYTLGGPEYSTYIDGSEVTTAGNNVGARGIFALKNKGSKYTLINDFGNELEVDEETLNSYIIEGKIIINGTEYRIKQVTEVIYVNISDA